MMKVRKRATAVGKALSEEEGAGRSREGLALKGGERGNLSRGGKEHGCNIVKQRTLLSPLPDFHLVDLTAKWFSMEQRLKKNQQPKL